MERPEISFHDALFDTKRHYSKEEYQQIKNEWIKYIDSKYGVGYSEENTCIKYPSGSLHFFGIHPKLAYLYGETPENILNCRVTIVDDHVSLRDFYQTDGYDENCVDYFSWIPYDDNDDRTHRISLIQPNIKLFSIQFPGGGDREAKEGAGKIVRLKVEII